MIPTDHDHLLLAAAPIWGRDTRGMRVTLNGHIELAAEHPDRGAGSVAVPYIERRSGDPADVVWGVNASYVADVLSVLGGTVEVGIRDGLSQMTFTRGDVVTIVMPMRT